MQLLLCVCTMRTNSLTKHYFSVTKDNDRDTNSYFFIHITSFKSATFSLYLSVVLVNDYTSTPLVLCSGFDHLMMARRFIEKKMILAIIIATLPVRYPTATQLVFPHIIKMKPILFLFPICQMARNVSTIATQSIP